MSPSTQTARNRLATETSPYLLQHADNPVDWWSWCPEALEQARREDKPVLLSIGYSACHWCHVMAHESFGDEATAAVMNALFVNIKVDREERPDLDKAYQLAHQLLTRRPGGWPLNVFLNPHDLVPFFSGTYFPKTPRYNLPDFVSVLKQVEMWYRTHKDDLTENHRVLLNLLGSLTKSEEAAWPDASILERSIRELKAEFDEVSGGFGGAPKFPQTGTLEFLLGCGWREVRRMALFTLQKMAEGGIYDQLGGGFCRYSVDAEWTIPHFEKMLYDNGLLLRLYALAWKASGNPLYRRVALETGEWVVHEMRSPEGGFYSSVDADSEGEEGRYYVWSRSEVRALLSPAEQAVIALHYGLNQTPNFEGHWHLRVVLPLPEVAERVGKPLTEVEMELAGARAKLLAARQQRIRPGCDDKVLTSWNALMIKGLATAGRVLGQARFIDAAQQAFDFIHDSLWIDGRLRASWKEGRARFAAYLDDYAFLIDAALELLQCRWSSAYLNWTRELAEVLLAQFEDAVDGGFFFTAHDHEPLIHRAKPMQDESMPSGNAVAAHALLRLGYLLGEERYLKAAERTLHCAAASLSRYPGAHGAMLSAVHAWRHPPRIIVLRGDPSELGEWCTDVAEYLALHELCLVVPSDAGALPGALAERRPQGVAIAYVCEGASCRPPARSLPELRRVLGG